MSHLPTEQSFLKDVVNHQMIILRDDGLYRHIRFKRPDSGCMHFDLVTWPGYLSYCGDMGCYVFSRIDDMFGFFRTSKNDWNYNRSGGLSINTGYWSEKLRAVDGNRQNGSATEFSNEKFERVINETRAGWMRECKGCGVSKNDRRELWDSVNHEVLWRLDDGHHVAMSAAHDFNHRIGRHHFNFEGLWEHDFTEYTYHFVWCCYALAWGVRTYDDSKERIAA